MNTTTHRFIPCVLRVSAMRCNQRVLSSRVMMSAIIAGYSSGRHYWELTISGRGVGTAGVCPEAKDANSHLRQHCYGHSGHERQVNWSLSSDIQGRLQFPALAACAFKPTDRVGFLLDMDQRTLTCFLNGRSLGVVQSNLPAQTLYPFIASELSHQQAVTAVAHFCLPVPAP